MLGQRIRELRKLLGLNQLEFGSRLGVTKQSVCNWENGNIQPSIDMLLRIAEVYSVSTDYMLGITQDCPLDVKGLTNEQVSHIQRIVDDIRKREH